MGLLGSTHPEIVPASPLDTGRPTTPQSDPLRRFIRYQPESAKGSRASSSNQFFAELIESTVLGSSGLGRVG